MREIVKYHKDMNLIVFKKFNKVETDLFFAICSKMREKGIDEITYSFDELRELSKYKNTTVRNFALDLEKTYLKMLSLVYRIDENNTTLYFTLFRRVFIDGNNKTVTIAVNEEFKYILNQLTSNFVRFELNDFIELKSTYSKTMYRLLKQFRTTGYYKVHIDEFRKLLDIPDTYNMDTTNKRVLAPIKKELPAYFKNLEIKKEKAKKGNKIEYIVFTFDKERAVKKQATIEYEKANTDITQQEFDDLIKELKKR